MKIKTRIKKWFGIKDSDTANPLGQPTIKIRNGWIPCDQAQPEFGQSVLALLQDPNNNTCVVGIAMRTSVMNGPDGQESWHVSHFGDTPQRIIAWCPLPSASMSR